MAFALRANGFALLPVAAGGALRLLDSLVASARGSASVLRLAAAGFLRIDAREITAPHETGTHAPPPFEAVAMLPRS